MGDGITNASAAALDSLGPYLNRARESPGAKETAERVKSLFLQLLADEITADEFDARVSPKDFGIASILWGIGSPLYRAAVPHMDRRKAKREEAEELRLFAESKAAALSAGIAADVSDDEDWKDK